MVFIVNALFGNILPRILINKHTFPFNPELVLVCFLYFFVTDSNMTIKKVAIGPRSNESRNQAKPLRFFV